MQNAEEVRNILLKLKRENSGLQSSSNHGKLLFRALEALLREENNADPFNIVFEALREIFDYSSAYALIQQDDELFCIASESGCSLHSVLPISSLFHKVLKGQVRTTFSQEIPPTNLTSENKILDPSKATLYLPIKVANERGILVLKSSTSEAGFSREDMALGQKFSLLASFALASINLSQSENERQALEVLTKKLEYQAHYDQLTGLPNRVNMTNYVDQTYEELQADEIFGLAFIDIDKFKQVNDYYGHNIGDQLLISVGKRISSVLRNTDMLCRLSGDEFVLLIRPVKKAEDIEFIVSKVMDAMKAPFILNSHSIHVGLSVGVSIAPDHGHDYETLRSNADNAMYRAKHCSKEKVIFFTSEMKQDLTIRMELEHKLRHAISQKSFICAFQPKVNLNTALVEGFEALVRWREEDGSIRSPGDFISLATELDLLDDITRIVATKVISAFNILDPVFGTEFSISLNVAGVQANDHEFMRELISFIAASGYSHRVVLELTEDAMVTATQFQLLIHPMLTATGIRVSIDDFGTGYSCLAALAKIEADELKIDRSFVTDVHKDMMNQKILFAIENLAQTIGLKIVAEGVETREELDFLLTHTSVEVAQGFFFARPMQANELIQLGSKICPQNVLRPQRPQLKISSL